MTSQKNLQQLTMEKDQALADLNSVERSLSDLFRRYENLKGVLEGFKKVLTLAYSCSLGAESPCGVVPTSSPAALPPLCPLLQPRGSPVPGRAAAKGGADSRAACPEKARLHLHAVSSMLPSWKRGSSIREKQIPFKAFFFYTQDRLYHPIGATPLCSVPMQMDVCFFFFQNEEALKKCAQDYLTRVKQEEQRYQALKVHAEEKLDK